MRELLVVQSHIAVQRGFQFLAGTEVMRLQHLFDAAVATFHHAVGLRVRRRGQAMFDAVVGAKQIERVLAGGAAFAQTEQAVGELAAIIGQDGAAPQRAGAFEIA